VVDDGFRKMYCKADLHWYWVLGFSLLTMFSKISADTLEHTACCKIMVENVGVKYESSKREIGGELQH
jgi:hypothetical protein